jgi:hypothetical protein
MSKTSKITEFSSDKVEHQLVAALKKNQGSATVADLVGLTGLPKYQIQTMLPVVVNAYRGHMQVTETGEVIYRFPQGYTNQNKGWAATWKRTIKKVLQVSALVLKSVFKAWIVLMLVGYFALFVFILIASVVISIALSFARKDEDRDDSGGGILGFYMVTRVFESFLLLWLYSGDPQIRDQKKKKPFFKAVFEFVFGVEEAPQAYELRVKKAVLAALQEKKGSITLEELMHMTGASRPEADRLISQLLLEMEGEPMVSAQGTLYFFFPELLKTTKQSPMSNWQLPERPLIPFSHNPPKTNRWIVFLNGFNLLLSAYFLGFGAVGFQALQVSGDPLSLVYQITVVLTAAGFHLSLAGAESALMTILGVVPALYSALFFGIPAVRRWKEHQKNRTIKTQNFRRRLIGRVLENPIAIRLDSLEPVSERDAVSKPGPAREAMKEQLLRELADSRSLEVDGENPVTYRIPDLEREKKDLTQLRLDTNRDDYRPGAVIFDTSKPV